MQESKNTDIAVVRSSEPRVSTVGADEVLHKVEYEAGGKTQQGHVTKGIQDGAIRKVLAAQMRATAEAEQLAAWIENSDQTGITMDKVPTSGQTIPMRLRVEVALNRRKASK